MDGMLLKDIVKQFKGGSEGKKLVFYLLNLSITIVIITSFLMRRH
jgi:hypothetical protein